MDISLHPSSHHWTETRATLKRWEGFSYRWRTTIVIIAICLIALRLCLPFFVKSYVNRQLNRIPEYRGAVGDIDIHLWRGAYRIKELRIEKTSSKVPVPFFYAPIVDLSMEWKELFHGAVVGEIILKQPKMNFVDGPSPDQRQAGIDRGWSKVIESLFPFRFNHFDVIDGELHFRNFHSEPRVDIFIRDLQASSTNLNNSRDEQKKYPAHLTARGHALGDGELQVDMELNPLAKRPTFKVKSSLTHVDLVALNDFLRAYGKFDVERGTFALYVEVESDEGRYRGYVKPLMENIDVFAWEKERKKNIFEIFWQAIVGTVATIFKNQPNDRIATTIPIEGDLSHHDIDLWTAIGGILKNAFVRALLPQFEPGGTGKTEK